MSILKAVWRSAPILLVAAMLFWAGNSIAGRALAGVVPPVTLAFWRWLFAFLFVTPLAWPHLKADLPELRRRWPVVVALSATGVASFGALLYVGLETTTALNSLLVQAVIPPLILLFAWVAVRERASLAQLAGVILSLAGVVVVIAEGQPSRLMTLRLNPGDGVVLVGVALYAAYSVILRARPKVHPLSLLWATFALAAPALAPFYALELMAGRSFTPSRQAFAGWAYVIVFPSLLAYLCFNRGVELIGAARAGQYLHLSPVIGAVLAVTLLGESFHAFHAVGVILIGAGIAAASLKRREPGSG